VSDAEGASATEVPADPIRHPRAYLVRIATRLALNRLRTLARQREDYVGPWLPEPVRTVPDVVDDVLLSESVSLAMLVVLESLAPSERAVFVLREVFGYDFGEIAAAVDRTPAAVRQIAHRAREHVQARRPRYDTDPRTVQVVMASFQRTLFSGDIQGLMDLMAPDVVLLNDGGGKRKAARRPVVGASNVAHFLVGIGQKAAGELRIDEVLVNGARAWSIYLDGEIYGVTQLVVHDGRIAQLFMVANPDKLTAMGAETPLTL
jgi:RNA polymerase sigma-70 factor (ECF subfamily)